MCSAFKSALVRLGILQSPTEVEVKEAETENLVVDRASALRELSQSTAAFKETTEQIAAETELRKDDLEELLGHMKNINVASGSANNIIERLIGQRHHPC